MLGVVEEPFDIKKFLFGKINNRLTILFLLVGIIAPAIGIYYFYSISFSLLSSDQEIFAEQIFLLDTATMLIIVLIAINIGIVGFFVSRSITKPIKKLHNMAQEMEKGNFDFRVDIKTNDEIAKLGDALNMSAIALGKIEEERKQLEKAKSEFLSMTSHELRTPITPVKAQIQMLQAQYFGELTEKQKESLSIVLRNTERLGKMIEDFLEISRIEAARLKFNFRETNLKETIEETVGLMTCFAKEKNIKLISNIGTIPIVEADPDRVSQVLRNLIHNAIKFSKNNSEIEINAIPQKDHILFSVKDYGIGMNPKDQVRVFEPFYQIESTINREHEGTGLGLPICRGIVESQKGKIWAESALGRGSTFYFTFPLEPVIDVEPIKVLFSLRFEIEKELKEEFISLLGPMGIIEFNDLKNKNAIGKDDLFNYIDSLKELSILSNSNADEFKTNIGKIFGDYVSNEIREKEVLNR
ncbi:MAG: HAMP domain-containing histidine kinase [Thermoplasmatales archaeon]|nr:MAG: HAMP domain-containing histidine kinase [Thermoplasmatales archaeon]